MNILIIIKNYFISFIARLYLSHQFYCVLCGNYVGRFLPYRIGTKTLPPLMKALDLVGSDIDNFSCPRCNCHDRERHLLLYLKYSNMLEKFGAASVLHFAPEHQLSRVIKGLNPSLYIGADLYPTSSEIQRVDMLDMPFESESFDFIIANHVLEHVDNVSKALSEIHRVLKKGGYAILQTPYSAKLSRTFSDPGIKDNFARLHAYGQEDHVRLFGKSIFEEISSSGFINLVNYHDDLLKEVSAKKYGVNAGEPFFLFQRPV